MLPRRSLVRSFALISFPVSVRNNPSTIPYAMTCGRLLGENIGVKPALTVLKGTILSAMLVWKINQDA